MKVKDMTIADLPEIVVQYDHALERARRLTAPSHSVRNCQADLDASDAAWREVQKLQYWMMCLKNGKEIY